jgi:hypothetical protein
MEKMVPNTRTTGNNNRPTLSKGVGRKGDVRGVDVEVLAGSMVMSLEESAALAARRVVTILEKQQKSRAQSGRDRRMLIDG